MNAVGIPPLHCGRKTMFPDELGAHVAMRRVRRFLEKGHQYPNLIILGIPDPGLFRYRRRHLRLYSKLFATVMDFTIYWVYLFVK